MIGLGLGLGVMGAASIGGVAGQAYYVTSDEVGGFAIMPESLAYQDIDAVIPAVAEADPIALLMDVSKTPARKGILTRPAGFPFDPPVQITMTGGVVTTDYNAVDWQVPAAATYYLSPTGSDANDGLSVGSPKRSIGALLTALNAAPPTGATIYLAAGDYTEANSFNGVSPTFPCNWIATGGRARVFSAQAATWTKTAGRANVWQTTIANLGTAVVDTTVVDEFGIHPRLVTASSVGDADANPGSLYRSGTTLYVNLHDGREPDANVIVFDRSKTNTFSVSTNYAYQFFQNVDLWGAVETVAISGAGRLILDNCSVRYALAGNGLYTNMTSSVGQTTIVVRGDVAYNARDGLNYNGTHLAVEIGVTAVYNGDGSGIADNGSTGHVGVSIIRLNGKYRQNWTRNVHDIGACRSWIIGCTADAGRNGLSDQYLSGAFVVGRKGESDAARMWMEGCTSTADRGSDAAAYGGSAMHTLDCAGLTTTETDGTAVILDNMPVWRRGRHLYQEAIAKRPSVTVVGGKRRVKFSGAQTLFAGYMNFGRTNKVTLIGRLKKEGATGTARAWLGSAAAATSGKVQLLTDASTSRYQLRSTGSASSDAGTTSTAFNSPSTNIVTGICDVAAPSNKLRIDGVQVSSLTGSQGTPTYLLNPYWVGSIGGSANYQLGELESLALMDQHLSDDDLLAYEAAIS